MERDGSAPPHFSCCKTVLISETTHTENKWQQERLANVIINDLATLFLLSSTFLVKYLSSIQNATPAGKNFSNYLFCQKILFSQDIKVSSSFRWSNNSRLSIFQGDSNLIIDSIAQYAEWWWGFKWNQRKWLNENQKTKESNLSLLNGRKNHPD